MNEVVHLHQQPAIRNATLAHLDLELVAPPSWVISKLDDGRRRMELFLLKTTLRDTGIHTVTFQPDLNRVNERRYSDENKMNKISSCPLFSQISTNVS